MSEYLKATCLLFQTKWHMSSKGILFIILTTLLKLPLLHLCYCFCSVWKAVSLSVDESATCRTQTLFHCTCQVYSLSLVYLLANIVRSCSCPSQLASLAQSSMYLSNQHSDRKVRRKVKDYPLTSPLQSNFYLPISHDAVYSS